MPIAAKIMRTMRETEIPEEILTQFDVPDARGNRPEPIIAFINQMDELLTKEQRLLVMEQQGCTKTGKNSIATLAFGYEHADKTLEEKVALWATADIPYSFQCELNHDGTLSAHFDIIAGQKYVCVCSAIKKLSQPTHVSNTYCGCCGGFVRHNLQNALRVKLRLKEIVSSPFSSCGKKRCEWLFEILDK